MFPIVIAPGQIMNDSSGFSTLYLHDAFTDTDGKSLTAHTIAPVRPGSAAWNSWKVLSNAAIPSDTTTYITFSVLSNTNSNCVLQALVTSQVINSNQIYRGTGFVSRYTDANNCWIINFSPIRGTLLIVERNAGTFTSRASATYAFVANTPYLLRAELNGSMIIAKAYDATGVTPLASCSYALAALNMTVGVHGMYGQNVAGEPAADSIDDFKVFL